MLAILGHFPEFLWMTGGGILTITRNGLRTIKGVGGGGMLNMLNIGGGGILNIIGGGFWKF